MIAELIAIGDEIITGHVLDRNTAYIAPRLADIGIETVYKSSVGDDLKRMEEAIHLGLRRADLIITTGGLGPTDDDITKRAIVRVFKRNLVFHEEVLEDLKKRFAARGIEMPAINQNQALLPQGATFLPNKTGSAVGIVIEENNKIFISLPGVPREAQNITDGELIPFLKSKIKNQVIVSHKIRTTGIFESSLAEIVSPGIKLPDGVRFAYLPSYSGVDLRMIATGETEAAAREKIEAMASKIREAALKYIYAEGDATLEETIGKLLLEKGQQVAVAESCTAGLLAGKITEVPGSSGWFERGVVTYSNRSKTELLGVPEATLEKYGAVSAETAEAMAVGILRNSGADYGIAITGIAGPDGGTEEKPVGTVYIAVATAEKVVSKLFRLTTDREINRLRSVYAALEMLRRTILGIEIKP